MKMLALCSSIAIISASLTLSSCSSSRENVSPLPSISPEAKAEISSPVNCGTAKSDLRVLEEEKASVGKQILAGVRSIMPISAVVGILLGDYRDRVQVATGKYNEDLEAKIAEIRIKCGIKN